MPKQSSRNFKGPELFAVGLLMDDIRNPFMADFAFVIGREFTKLKINTVLCNICDVESEFVEQIDNLINKKVNGIIMMGSIFEGNLRRALLESRYSGFPFVSINGYFGITNVCEVILDQRRGIKDAVHYLHSLGRSKIGFIFKHQSGSDRRKKDGFLDGIRLCGLSNPHMVEVTEKSIDNGKKATAKLLSKYSDTDAIIYSSDTLAVGGAHYLNDQKISIPDRIMIVGFNNSASACDCYPPLTSIDNNIGEAGRAAAQRMLKMIKGEEAENIVVPSSLVIREST